MSHKYQDTVTSKPSLLASDNTEGELDYRAKCAREGHTSHDLRQKASFNCCDNAGIA